MTFALNQPARITFKTYSDAAKTTLADATTVVLSLRDPTTGTVTTPTVTHDSTGIYHYDLPDTTAGLWQYRWVATGAVATSSLTGAVNISEAWPSMLVGLDDVKTDTNITSTADDDELSTFIYTASAILLNHPDYRVADVCKVETYTEDWTRGGDTAILDHYPVTSATVTEYSGGTGTVLTEEGIDTASFSGYGYRVDPGGLLKRLDGSGAPMRFLGPVRVEYTAGSASIPWEIRRATLDLIAHLWETQRGGEGSGLPTGDDLEPDSAFTFGSPPLLPPRVSEALRNYRRASAVA